MAAANIYVFVFFTALVAVNIIFAEDSALQQKSFAQEEEGQERTFFLFRLTTTCNSTTQGGSTCASCTQALRCLANNIGVIRNCRGLLPYCNNGRCSFLPGANCSSG